MSQLLDGISLCIIARNEERNIARCLNSVKDFVLEMIVVDTGSEDSTREIATGLGAAVHEFPWTGDFSEARNHSLRQAKANWILVLDADEMLAERDAKRLRQITRGARADGFKLIQRTYLKDANFVCACPNPKDYVEGQEYTDCINVGVIRLFRNDSRIWYEGRVHELVEPVFAASKSLVYEDTDLVLHHFGKVGDAARLEQKKVLYLNLGKRKAIEEPRNALAQFEVGVQLYELARYAECIPYFEASLKLNPAYDMAYLYIAKALHANGQKDEASRCFQKCLGYGPDNDSVLFDYANLVRDQGHTNAALKLYRRAIKANPRHSLALFNMGALLICTGEAHEGVRWIEKAIHLNRDNASFHENFGRLPLPAAELPVAVRLVEDYVQRFPDAVECLVVLAEACFKLGEFDRALDFAERANLLRPARVDILLVQANASFSLRRLEDAEQYYRAALALDPNNLDSMMNLAAIAEMRGEHAEARHWYLRILETHPGQPQALKRFAAAQNRNGLDDESLDSLDRACTDDVSDPECLLLVGSVLERRGRIDRATKLYRSAVQRKPEWAATVGRKVEQLEMEAKQRRNIACLS